MSIPGLTFNALRDANMRRVGQFKNAKGEPAHAMPDGSDWSLNDWMAALAGEVGEAANILKKVRRGDLSLEEARLSLAREYADIVTYLDILAAQTGVDLGEATIQKFNEVSERVDCDVRLARSGGTD